MAPSSDHFELSTGATIPSVGFGTWQIPEGAPAYDAVAAALAAGYRHIDTAHGYGNEASVGRAIAESGLDRAEVFVTTKIPARLKTYASARASIEESLAALGTDYVDLHLIHAPWPWEDIGSDHRAGNIEVWRALEEAYEAGRARAIGVSNFEVTDLEALGTTHVVPHVNQIRVHVGHRQSELTAYCRDQGILVEGYSPLGTGAILSDPVLGEIAASYGRSVAQIALRYLLQREILPLPKTVTPVRIAENLDLDFEISESDVRRLDGVELAEATS
ncbi:aldo/keto reductase [Nocardioides sp. W7]|uniref:aldo/keto reductase n=1 Tax=Nocardioides sp. W7 TaxID=2931390 RepID=UPI001FD10A4C|nr:aldo/keto reductase [Nocardioides sp. W7]